MAGTSTTSEIDFDANGKHAGYLRVPHSVHRSAYGWLPLPVTCIKTTDGPTLVIMAGNHGDEYEGQIAVSNLARSLEASDIRGRLILLPMVNAPAAEAGLRTSPYSGIALCKRAMAQVVRGDAVYQIASDATSKADKA